MKENQLHTPRSSTVIFKKVISFQLILYILIMSSLSIVDSQAQDVQRPKGDKVFLHLDKDVAITGTSINFTAFVINATDKKLKTGQGLLYIKLLNQDGQIVAEQRQLLKNGKGIGEITIKDNLGTGKYFLLAFTTESMAKSFQNAFKQEVSIINPKQSFESKPRDFAMNFYPEGGAIIPNQRNNVVFKVTPGMKTWKGVLLNQSNDTLFEIKPYAYNLGSFSFFPKKEEKYKVKVDFSGEIKEFKLPACSDTTVSARIVDISEEILSLVVNIGDQFDGKILGLVIYNNEDIVVANEQPIYGNRAIFKIPKQVLPEGLNTIHLINENKDILSTRLFYKRGIEGELILDEDELRFSSDNKIELPIRAQSSNSHVQNTNIDCSVIIKNDQFFDTMPINDMALYFEIFSKHKVTNPSVYIPMMKSDNQFMDLYLGTLKSEHQNISDLYHAEDQPSLLKYETLENFIISGTVRNQTSQSALKNRTIFCTLIGNQRAFYVGKTDSLGRFIFKIKSFEGDADIILQADYGKDISHDYSYELEKMKIDPTKIFTSSSLSINQQKVLDYIAYTKEAQLLDRVYYPDVIKEKNEEPVISATGFFRDYTDSKILAEYVRLKDFEQISKELFPGMAIRNEEGKKHIYLREIDNSGRNSFMGRFAEKPLILIDGLPIFDHQSVFKLDTKNIETISLINNKFFVNGQMFYGAIEISTLEADFYKSTKNMSHDFFTIFGFSKEKPESQKNFQINTGNDKLPDFRDILYWDFIEDLELSNNSELEIPLSDDIGEFSFEVIGINGEGNILSHYGKLKVK